MNVPEASTQPTIQAHRGNHPDSAAGSSRCGVPAWTLDAILDSLPAGVDYRLSPELEAELRG